MGGYSETFDFIPPESSQAVGTADKTAEFWAPLFPDPDVEKLPHLIVHLHVREARQAGCPDRHPQTENQSARKPFSADLAMLDARTDGSSLDGSERLVIVAVGIE